ncbi:MAG: transposase [Pseudomonadota bacterium]
MNRQDTQHETIKVVRDADCLDPERGLCRAQVKDLCRKNRISDVTFYNLNSKYGGMEASCLKQMKELERELSQFTRMYVELARDNDAMRNLIDKRF